MIRSPHQLLEDAYVIETVGRERAPTEGQLAAVGNAQRVHEENAAEGPTRAHKYTAGGAKQVEKLSYSHTAMIDSIIANPGITQRELGKHFGYTESWVSTIMASDAFQVLLAERRAELIDPILTASVGERLKAMTQRSIEIVQSHLEGPMVSFDVAMKAAQFGAKAMGLGGNAPPQTLVMNSSDRLAGLAERLTGLLANKRGEVKDEIIEVESREVGSGGGE